MNEEIKKIRAVRRDDSRRIWEIRNNPLVRQFSGNHQSFGFDSHDHWFEEKYFSGQNNHCYVLEINNQVQGYCRLDFNSVEDWYVISIALDPALQGKGMGNELMKVTIQDCAEPKKVFAEIKKVNMPSVKFFQKNGFQPYREDNDNFYLIYQNTGQ